MMYRWLKEKFTGVSTKRTPEEQEKIVLEHWKKKELDSISEWILKSADKISKDLPEFKKEKQKKHRIISDDVFCKGSTRQFHVGIIHSYVLGGRSDVCNAFTREDLKALKPALCKLHQACQRANVAVTIHGLDILPQVVSDNQFEIRVYPSHYYNYDVNPYSDEDYKQATRSLSGDKRPK